MSLGEVFSVALVGAGTMGSRIGYRCAVSGLETYLYDKHSQALEKSIHQIQGWMEQKVDDGQLSAVEAASARARLNACHTLRECVADADLVIEAVPENLELKRQVLAEIDRLAPARTLIATNSSAIPCSRIADATRRPEKVFNINFSDPTHDLIVEIMKGAQTADETLAAGEGFVRSLNMVPIVTLKEIMGFSFNRVWRSVKREALHLVDGGYAGFEDIDRAWMLEFGTPFGPFGLMDSIGLDVIRDVEMQYYLESKDERDKPPEFLNRFIAENRLGAKSGRGFYRYPNPEYKRPGWLQKKAPWTPEQLIGID